MASTRRYQFARFWASVLLGLGFAFMVIGPVSAGLLLLLSAEIRVPRRGPAPW